MFIRLFLILAALVGIMWLAGRLGGASTHDRIKYLKLAALYGGLGLLLILIFTGRLHALFALLLAAVPWIQRAIMLQNAYQMFKSWSGGPKGPVQGSKPGQTSNVRTRFIDMTLDHDSGSITGVVVRGAFKDKSLDELSIAELSVLLAECQKKDSQSASVLESYLDRMRADEWREYVDEHPGSDERNHGSDEMTRDEALKVLGLSEGASRDEIIKAHKKLMRNNHPDRGGSTWLAARINRAKDILLS